MRREVEGDETNTVMVKSALRRAVYTWTYPRSCVQPAAKHRLILQKAAHRIRHWGY